MKINVPHIAKLANLKITEEESKTLEQQLSSILDYIKKLEEVNTKNIETTSQVTKLENITRKDEAKPSLAQEESLLNAPKKHNGLFEVDAIFNE